MLSAESSIEQEKLPFISWTGSGFPATVMVAVVRGPPKWALLGGHRAAERPDELRDTVEPVRLVCEIPVIPGRDEEHPGRERDEREDQRGPRDSGEDREEGDQVHCEERERGADVEPVVFAAAPGR